MGPTKFLLLRQLCSKFSLQPTKTCTFTSLLINRSYSAQGGRQGRIPDSRLFTRINLIGSSNASVSPLLDQWVEEGNRVQELEFRRIVRLLRNRHRYSQALESQKMVSKAKLNLAQAKLSHARDLVEIRVFMRALIESKNVGRKIVGDHLTSCGWLGTLERVFEEELNYEEYRRDPELRSAVLSGKRVLALPVADMSLVKHELRRSERLKKRKIEE